MRTTIASGLKNFRRRYEIKGCHGRSFQAAYLPFEATTRVPFEATTREAPFQLHQALHHALHPKIADLCGIDVSSSRIHFHPLLQL